MPGEPEENGLILLRASGRLLERRRHLLGLSGCIGNAGQERERGTESRKKVLVKRNSSCKALLGAVIQGIREAKLL